MACCCCGGCDGGGPVGKACLGGGAVGASDGGALGAGACGAASRWCFSLTRPCSCAHGAGGTGPGGGGAGGGGGRCEGGVRVGLSGLTDSAFGGGCEGGALGGAVRGRSLSGLWLSPASMLSRSRRGDERGGDRVGSSEGPKWGEPLGSSLSRRCCHGLRPRRSSVAGTAASPRIIAATALALSPRAFGGR